MKTEKVLLSQLKVNAANPRTITNRKLQLLVERLLAFPKMITLRPVITDGSFVALGGNMRLRAFMTISHMTIEDIAEVLAKTKNFQRLSKAEQEKLLEYWQKWLEKPTVSVAKASDLSEEEKKEFIIADNASFGEWDYDKLANEWDSNDLVNWGVDVWQPEPPQGSSSGGGANGLAAAEAAGGEAPFDGSNLPPELQGQDINPDDLPKIEGDNATAMERVILVYPKERTEEIARLLGLEKIDKVVYNINELIPDTKAEEQPADE